MIILVDIISPSPTIPQIVDTQRHFRPLETFKTNFRTLLGKFKYSLYDLKHIRATMVKSIYCIVQDFVRTKHHLHLDRSQYHNHHASDKRACD